MSDASARAVCSGCGKTYAVPDPSRIYTCKACGGRVAVADASCTACGAELGAGEAFCGACGAAQGAEVAREKDVALDAEERRQASFELQRALKALGWVRWILALNILGNGVTTVVLLTQVQETPEWIVELLPYLALSTALTCLSVVGFRQARLQPFLWSLTIASLSTVNLAVTVLAQEKPWPALVLPALLVGVLWCCVPPTARVRRLIAEHPDLYVAHKLHGTEKRRSSSRGSPDQSRGQFEAAKARTARGSMAWAAGIVVAVALATFALWNGSRHTVFEPRLVAFESAWGASDAAALAALAPPGEVAERHALLEAMVEAHGWGANWPDLGEVDVARGASVAKVAWQLDDDVVVSNWTLTDDGWQLSALRLPLPPLDAPVQRLVGAWNARDIAALAALYPPDKRESAAKSIARVVERRAWGDAWPELLDANAAPRRETGATVTFRVAGDELVTRWDFREELGWCMTSLNLPD